MMQSGCARRPSSGPSGFYPLPPFASRLRPHSRSQTLWPQRSIGPRTRLTHDFPLPPSNPRAAPGFALALRAIRHPDACERLTPLVVLFWMLVVFVVYEIRGCPNASESVGVLLLVVLVSYLLGIMRPIRRIPAVAENGDINAPGAARRSLSGTHFALKWPTSATEKGEGSLRPLHSRRLAG